MKIKIQHYYYALFTLAFVALGFICTFILPEKFFNDAKIIVFDKHEEIGFMGSYPLTIFFYKITGLRYLPYFLVALVQLPMLYWILYKIGIPAKFHVLSLKNIIVYVSLLLIAVFICIPSKEFITFIYMSFIVLLFQSKANTIRKTLYICGILLVFYGVFFRPYFVLLPVIAGVMYLVSLIRLKNRTASVIFFAIIAMVFITLSYGVVKGEYISQSTRESHNLDRMGSDQANSMIVSPVETDTWYGETFAVFYGFLTVNIPVTAFKFILSPQILLFALWQLALIAILYQRFRYCLENRGRFMYEVWIFIFIFAYFVTQGLFEPDLGSAIRHKIGIFPIIYYAIYHEQLQKQKFSL